MSAGPATALGEAQSRSPQIASSAVVVGSARLGEGSLLAEDAVIRSHDTGVEIGTGSAVLENSVVIGTTTISTTIGRRTVFGHRCKVIGATVGDLCEIGNASTLIPGTRLGDRLFLGEGTLVPAGMSLPSDVVAVGRPARVVRSASADDLGRLLALRGGDMSVPPPTAITVEHIQETIAMGQLYAYRGTLPTVAASAALFTTAEITGDVVIGEQADELLGELLERSHALGYHILWAAQHVQAVIAAARGDFEATWALTDEMSRWAEPRGMHAVRWYAQHARTLAAMGQGDYDYAYQRAAAISPPGTFAPYVPHALWVALDLVEAAVHTTRHAEAAAHVTAMRDEGIAALSPRLALVAGASAAIAASNDQAGKLFDEALALPGVDRWPFDMARVQLAYGARLRRTGARIEARKHLSAALDTFQWLGAHPWAARASNELRATGRTSVRANISAPTRLTPQEPQIATLAAAGLTNKEIGERLELSHWTVGSHLYRIFPKLGIATRSALRDALAATQTGPPDEPPG